MNRIFVLQVEAKGETCSQKLGEEARHVSEYIWMITFIPNIDFGIFVQNCTLISYVSKRGEEPCITGGEEECGGHFCLHKEQRKVYY